MKPGECSVVIHVAMGVRLMDIVGGEEEEEKEEEEERERICKS